MLQRSPDRPRADERDCSQLLQLADVVRDVWEALVHFLRQLDRRGLAVVQPFEDGSTQGMGYGLRGVVGWEQTHPAIMPRKMVRTHHPTG